MPARTTAKARRRVSGKNRTIESKHSTGIFSSGKLNNVYWLNNHVIVSLSRHQLFFWSVEFERKMLRYKITKDKSHSCHLQEIVSFACDSSKEMIWLCRNNRQIGMMNPKTGRMADFYGTVAFGVRAMAECPDDMNK